MSREEGTKPNTIVEDIDDTVYQMNSELARFWLEPANSVLVPCSQDDGSRVSDEPMKLELAYPQIRRWSRSRLIERLRGILAIGLLCNVTLLLNLCTVALLFQRVSMRDIEVYLSIVYGPIVGLAGVAVGYYLPRFPDDGE